MAEEKQSVQNGPSQAQVLAALRDELAKAQAKQPLANLAKAFVAAKRRIGSEVTKNSANPHFGSNYADLAAVLDAFTGIFAEEGLVLMQAPGEIVDGNVTLAGLLLHESGESISIRTQLPLGPKATAQAAGSALTYARRYQAAAVVGLAQVDDDGNSASEPAKEKPGKRAASKAPPEDYAVKAEQLRDKIAASTDEAGLKALKQEVADFGDKAVADAYVARLREHREAAKGAAK